jgi:hypothetical protein
MLLVKPCSRAVSIESCLSGRRDDVVIGECAKVVPVSGMSMWIVMLLNKVLECMYPFKTEYREFCGV